MAAASPLVSPALRQQWRRAVQTATRLAVVAMKDGRRQFESCSTAGQELLQALAADILALQQLPTMKFGALEQLQGLREAAARKLSHRQVVKLGALQQSCQKLQQAVQTMEEALAAVAAASAQVSPAPGPSTPTSGHHAPAATPDVAAGGAAGSSAREVSGLELGSGVLPGVPVQGGPPGSWSWVVFSCLPLSSIMSQLGQVVGRYRLEAGIKQQLVVALEVMVDPVCRTPVPPRLDLSVPALEARLNAWLATWTLAPYLDSERDDMALAVVAEDMTGW